MNLQREIQKLVKLQEFARNDLKHVIGVEAVRDSKQNFRDGGFDGQPWTPRKRKNRKGKKDTKPLTDTGDLGDSIDYNADFNKVDVGTPFEWAKVHNEGLRAGRGNGFQMPKRQFLGVSERMKSKLKSKIDTEVKRILGK
jgi:phage virion morphogenesis protein